MHSRSRCQPPSFPREHRLTGSFRKCQGFRQRRILTSWKRVGRTGLSTACQSTENILTSCSSGVSSRHRLLSAPLGVGDLLNLRPRRSKFRQNSDPAGSLRRKRRGRIGSHRRTDRDFPSLNLRPRKTNSIRSTWEALWDRRPLACFRPQPRWRSRKHLGGVF